MSMELFPPGAQYVNLPADISTWIMTIFLLNSTSGCGLRLPVPPPCIKQVGNDRP